MFADIIIDENGQTWVSEKDKTHWPAFHYKIEDLRAKDFDRSRSARYPTGTRTGRFSSRDPYEFTRRARDYYEGSDNLRNSDPIAEGLRIHSLMEEWFKNNGPA